MKTPIQGKLIRAGVANLREFGYPQCTEQNILTDTIYKAFFLSMLKDNLGAAGAAVDVEINNLIREIGE